MKKVLILTTSTGQGHNQAADSIIEAFNNTDFECIKHDFLIDNKIINKVIVIGYEIFASKFPKSYGLFYKLTDKNYINKSNIFIFLPIIKKLSSYINKEKPDVIIGTHPFTVDMITYLKGKGLNTPFVSVITDFKAHYTYINPLVDSYITASESTKDYLISQGIKEDIIYPIGIPIKSNFYDKNEEISSIKNDGYFNLLLMSGSMGLNNISYVLDELLKNENKLRITVVCGNNEYLKKSLLSKTDYDHTSKKLHILGFSNDISSLMDYCDVLISKPGGLTSTEAIVKNIPLIIPFAIPGQELDNTEFLVSNNYAYSLKNYSEINDVINMLIKNPDILLKMKKNLNKLSSSYCKAKIVDICNDLIKRNTSISEEKELLHQ